MSGYKERWRGFLLSAIFTAGGEKKPLQLNLPVTAGTAPQLETNLQRWVKWGAGQEQHDGVSSTTLKWKVNKALPPPHFTRRHPIFMPPYSLLQSSPVTPALSLLRPSLFVKMNSSSPQLCVMKAQCCCRELSTLNLNYLQTESTNCGRQEPVNLTQSFTLLWAIGCNHDLRSCLRGVLQITSCNRCSRERQWLCLHSCKVISTLWGQVKRNECKASVIKKKNRLKCSSNKRKTKWLTVRPSLCMNSADSRGMLIHNESMLYVWLGPVLQRRWRHTRMTLLSMLGHASAFSRQTPTSGFTWVWVFESN